MCKAGWGNSTLLIQKVFNFLKLDIYIRKHWKEEPRQMHATETSMQNIKTRHGICTWCEGEMAGIISLPLDIK